METTSNTNARVVVKLSFAGETHRLTLDQNAVTFDALCALVPEMFVQPTPKSYALVYTDNEGDLVTVSSALELNEACRVFLDLNGERKTMHFRVLPRVSVKDQIPPAVLQAVDELSSTIARLASDTRESLSQSMYLERGRASVAHSAKQTREFLESARKEIAQRLKDVQARIVGEIERRRSSASNADEAAVTVATTFEEQSTEAIEDDEGIDMEARHSHHIVEDDSDDEEEEDCRREQEEEAGDSDDEDVEEKQHEEENDDDDDSVPPPLISVAEAAAAIAHLPREHPHEDDEREQAELPYESDAETVASDEDDEDDDGGSDHDWEDVVPDVWNAEVALIRSILPHVHVEDCVEMLQKHNGNLEAALNELTDL